MSWKQFIQAHMDTTWASDFFTEEVWTWGGLVTFYVFFLIHLGRRRVYMAGCTPNPDSVWMAQQARNFCMRLDESPQKCRHVIHDGAGSFLAFDRILETEEIEGVKTPPRAPKCNAFAERFVREARETLNNLIVMGYRHLHHTLKSIEHHHNHQRPHQGIENRILLVYDYPGEPAPPDTIQCESSVGGLLNHYYVEHDAA